MNSNMASLNDAILENVSGGVFDPTEHTVCVNSSNFNSVVCSSPSVILLFGAGWASSCVKLRKSIESLASEHVGSVLVGIVDTDKEVDLCMDLNINSIPTTIKSNNGVETIRITGFQSIDSYRNLF